MAVDSVRDPVNGVPFKGSDSSSITSGASLAETFDTFLTLLTTQLQHQDPLNPMDTNEFTSQLVEFTGVEQAISTNQKLDALIGLQADMQLNDAVGYIDKLVGADGIILMLQDGESTITYDLGANAAETSILIIDEEGNTVRTLEGETGVGHHEIVWDGLDKNGEPLDDGLYGFLVTAIDADKKPVPLVQGTVGKVTGVKLVDGVVTLEVGELEIALSDVLAVSQ
ncbi:MAG TPA: flagellar hook capping FlgD N-terminal domain-containing protein [Kiloniellaceae bacterium]